MTSGSSMKGKTQSKSLELAHTRLAISWDDVICPVCLEIPHNGILLVCSSYEKGCHPFICDTDYMHSNCLERFKTANGLPASSEVTSTAVGAPGETIQLFPSNENCQATCPLCRGRVIGWIAVDEARAYMNMKIRCCEEKSCAYFGNYMDLQNHVRLEHPHSRPAEIDPARQLYWDNFQQSSEIIDVLSTVHAETPRGVVLGDYIIEYGDDDSEDEYEDFPGDEGSGWTSCILYQVFDNFRAARSRMRSRLVGTRRERPSYDDLERDDGFSSSIEVANEFGDSDDGSLPINAAAASTSRGSSRYRSSRRRRLSP